MDSTWLVLACAMVLSLAALASGETAGSRGGDRVERWDIFDLALQGPAEGNPYTDVQLAAEFRQGKRRFSPEGFYDGQGTYRVRFMPDAVGTWEYVTRSNCKALDGRRGSFVCMPASKGNHGPLTIRNKVHFAYADGTPYYQVGTTCYAWAHQGARLEKQTLATLAKSPFNKIRMCVFPKSYAYNKNEPEYYPFQGKPLTHWDLTRFNPEFWRHFEGLVGQLRSLGIQADLILFHPYDRWDFSRMPREADDRYLRYCVARLAAYRNVWWSLANEYDLMLKIPSKQMADWDRFFQIIQRRDPYGRMRGIHNCRTWYDHSKPWVTHASIQSSDFRHAAELRVKYGKPIIYDECRYEGDIPQGWGHLTAREMVDRFYLGGIQGCYVGHGETYKHPKDILWWSKGGVLHGQSPPRIAFFRKIMEAAPYEKMTPDKQLSPGNLVLAAPGAYYLIYFPRAGQTSFELPGNRPYRAEAIDTWTMTVQPIGAVKPGAFTYAARAAGHLLRLIAGKPGEPLPPIPTVRAEPARGTVPLTVRFTASPAGLDQKWSFGDGARSSRTNPSHTYATPGAYTATVTVTDEAGRTGMGRIQVYVDAGATAPLVRVGVAEGESPITLHGDVRRGEDGSLMLAAGEPWKWISIGKGAPTADVAELRSFTISGWLRPSSLKTGMGGNRIAFSLNYDRAGFDLVHHADGRLRLAVNQWPDRVRNDSSPGKLSVGTWTFFAVTYDAAKAKGNVRWYFGDAKTPAALDRTTTHAAGPIQPGGGPLTIGNYNETIHRHGKDRQFRGRLRDIRIYGSRLGSAGALDAKHIRAIQVGK